MLPHIELPETTLEEEVANSITHGLGVILSLVAVPAMITLATLRHSATEVWGVAIFGVSILLLYISSTIYHSITHKSVKRVFRLMDHISIFFLIAGSYTPFMLMFLPPIQGYTMLGIIWGLALMGIIYKAVFLGKNKWIGIGLYVCMGWLVVFVGGSIIDGMHGPALLWLAIGGLSYTVGVIFYRWKSLRFHHAIWHVFVLIGTGSHYTALMLEM